MRPFVRLGILLLSLGVATDAVADPASLPVPRLALCELEAWILEGDQTDGRFGTVSTAGDVNGDGYDDVLFGAYNYDHPEPDEGVAYLYLGSPAGIASAPAWMAESNQAGAHLADKLSTAGDVNGDGYDDVILGAGDLDADGLVDQGRAFLYLGSPDGLALEPAWTKDGGQADGRFAANVSTAGDVNGDGYDDVVIGAWLWDEEFINGGKAFVFLGSDSGLADTPAWTGRGESYNAVYGYRATTAGDLDGDGYDDLVVGSRRFSGDGISREGRAYVYYGTAEGPSPEAGWTFDGEQAGAEVGSSVAGAGDVNADGYDDLIVAAFRYDAPEVDEGKVFLFLGGPDGAGATPAWTAEGDQPDAYFGYHVTSAGDVNGDGYADVLIGVAQWDADSLANAGRVQLYLGCAEGLEPIPAWTVDGDQAGGQMGNSVSRASDVNGDGFGDLLVGELYRDNEWIDAGRGYLFYGCALEPAAIVESDERGGPVLLLDGAHPSRGPTELLFTVAADGWVSLTVHDAAGGVLRRLEESWRRSGTHRVVWDARDDQGRSIPGGVYFLVLKSSWGVRAIRIVRLPGRE